MTRKQYKWLTLAMQPGHLQEQHLCCIRTQSTHHIKVSYLNILKKAKLIFPQLKQLMLFLFFYKICPRLDWGGGMLLFPQSSTPGTGSEVWLETQGPKEKQVVGTKLQWALLEPIRSSYIWGLGTWDRSISAHFWALGNRNLGHVSPNYLVHII